MLPFLSTLVYNRDILESRLRELSFLNKGVRIVINDLREMDDEGKFYTKTFYSEGGIVEFLEMLDSNAAQDSTDSQTHLCEGA